MVLLILYLRRPTIEFYALGQMLQLYAVTSISLFDEKSKDEIKFELGDVLWYISQLASELGYELDDIANSNLQKLKSRKVRGKIQGSGDDR